jgi:hypothetical protein
MNTEIALPYIGMYTAHAGTFFFYFSLVALLTLGLPLLFAPVQWARILGWSPEGATDLAVYFARSLGMVASSMSLVGMALSPHAEALPAFFNLTIAMCTGAAFVHIVGWAQKRQPIKETLEIPLWFAFAGAAYLFYPRQTWVLF